jgi:crotonobetainyl-CoA:carnitine CoA-transferase CaiB-like acyl-CoA transferase
MAAPHGVLHGIRVLDFAWYIAGPMIGKYLSQYGAEVIHVETVLYLDLLRQLLFKDNQPDPDRSVAFSNYNDGKLGITLNLNHPKGVDIARRLIAISDVVIESFTPRAMRKWGLSYEQVRQVKPDIIMLSSCMQGQTGPYANSPGNGVILPALAGMSEITGWPDRAPTGVGGPYTDFTSGPMGMAAILSALIHRKRTGEGQYIDLSQNEAGMHFTGTVFLEYTANGRIPTRHGNRRPGFAPHGVYPCQGDDAWCTIAVHTEAQWQALCRVMGSPAWTQETRFATRAARETHAEELDQLLGAWTVQQTAREVMQRLQAGGVPAAVVQNARDLASDAQLQHRQHYVTLQHPVIGANVVERLGFQLSTTPGGPEHPAPRLGQHNAYVYGTLLGMNAAEMAKLVEEEVIA